MKKIVVCGAGGLGREVLMLIRDINRTRGEWDIVGFVDDAPAVQGTIINDLPVVGNVDWLCSQEPMAVAIGVGSPGVRRQLVHRISRAGHCFPVLVHPNVVMSPYVRVGRGSLITAGNILTVDIRLGEFCLLNLACTVGHDSVLDSFVTLSPDVNVSGNVAIREGADIGTGSAIVQGVEIGEWSIVGAGAVVAAGIPPNCTAVGVPARPIKQREAGWHQPQLAG